MGSKSSIFGVQDTRLDGQFRFPLPHDLSKYLDNNPEDLRIVPAPNGRYLDIFTVSRFNEFFNNFMQQKDISPTERQVAIDGYFSRAGTANVDTAHRVTIPKIYRDMFKGSKKIVMQGRGPMLRIMSESEWQRIDQETRSKVASMMEKIEQSAYIDATQNIEDNQENE